MRYPETRQTGLRTHFPHEDQSERAGYGSVAHVHGRTVITACGIVFSLRSQADRYTTVAEMVTCESCIRMANIKRKGRRTRVPWLRVIDGAA